MSMLWLWRILGMNKDETKYPLIEFKKELCSPRQMSAETSEYVEGIKKLRLVMMKIDTLEVIESEQHLGWKVYINGEKFPKKPQNYYNVTLEESAKMRAIVEYQEIYGE